MSGRLPALVPDDLEVERLLDPYRLPDGRPLPIFQALAHSRAALDDLRRATAACMKGTALDARTRELAVLRVCARVGAESEWAVHVEMFAREAGLSDAEVRATTAPPHSAPWSPRDQLVLAVADEITATSTLSDELWGRVAAAFPPREIVELLLVVTQYQKVACLTNALGLKTPRGLPRLPDQADTAS
ncbi:carboxymuconolactone decarboxylase family protein [Actinomadura opuntiae]|uniref:carboxymuconolactone decarboxylase family protein n=1 Tax=Actinomadura sp. OS1-43 TaxID=604315 RepID=UPI00255AA90F|nr:carboxymuconolactone decarboxylase family protein [Actinomadura sp. OS1-43]MDL4817313.1 carboxymuconolactone decarboxylase family protein [Actinomadura sp. OS1-43]